MVAERGDGESGTASPGHDAQDTAPPTRVLAFISGIVITIVVIAAIFAFVRPASVRPASDNVFRLGPEGLSDKSAVGRTDLAPVGTITGERALADAAPRLGAVAPNLAWVSPEGATSELSALRGHPVVINFWATWCIPCRQEMPALDRIAISEPGLTVLAVDLQEDSDSVRAFFERYQIRSLVPLIDPNGQLFRRYGVVSLPTTFFVDREGVIRHVEIGGPVSEERLRADVAKATTP